MKEQLQHKIDDKTKPQGSLGLLESIALKIGNIQKTLSPVLQKPQLLVFAADHGLADVGVSPFPKEVTYQMVLNFLSGGAAVNVFCRQNNIEIKVVDAGVDYDFPDAPHLIHAKIAKGTQNIMRGPAMTSKQCIAAIEKGKELANVAYNSGTNVIGCGEMGIGNTSSASLLMSKVLGLSIESCVGAGAGHHGDGLRHKLDVLSACTVKHHPTETMDILATFGGFEIAMMCGVFLQAKQLKMVILLDGFIATSALLIASKLDPFITDNVIACHQSDEAGHKTMLDALGLKPVLNIGMRLGEGSGAAVAYPLVESAVNFLNHMASFANAGVSNKDHITVENF